MQVRRYRSAGRFLERAGGVLLEREEENNLLLGVAGTLAKKHEELDAKVLLGTVEEDGVVVGAVMRTPPFPLAVSRLPEGGARAVAEDLGDERRRLTGVVAATGTANDLAREVCRLEAGMSYRAEKSMGVYRLDRVVPPARPAEGRFLVAQGDHLEAAVELTEGFQSFVNDKGFDARKLSEGAIADERLFLWEHDGEIVSMAAWVRETPNAMTIALVFTPEQHRNNGYASSLVAETCRRALRSGKRSCVLFADNDNPTSTGIYEKLGYEKVSDTVHLAFEHEQ